jgi:hypothetical protein
VAVDGNSAAVRGVMTLDAETGLALALSRKFVELHGGGPDLGHEPGGRGLDVHGSAAPRRLSPDPTL